MLVINSNQYQQNLKCRDFVKSTQSFKTDNDQVPVNGIAIAPYMISVALFCCSNINKYNICEIAFRTSSESRWPWLKSRAEINGIIAVLAGILVYGGVLLV